MDYNQQHAILEAAWRLAASMVAAKVGGYEE